MNILLYTWWDGDVPFYVGIGNPGREVQWRKRNPHCYAKRKSAESKGTFKVLIELTGLSWEEAWDLEKKRIAEIGMISQGTGPLTNYAEGGNGGNTQLGWDEDRKQKFKSKMSDVNSSRPPSSYGQTKNTFWITNGMEQTRQNREAPIPEGWKRGRLPHRGKFEKRSAPGNNAVTVGSFWITNGKDNILIPSGDPIPIHPGWYRGITKSHYRGKPT
jgi:hypothetical protein